MTRKDTLEALCKLARQVMEAHDCLYAADCFCDGRDRDFSTWFTFDPVIMKFIQDAVKEKLEREKKKKKKE